MKTTGLIVVSLFTVLLIGCDARQDADGLVIDKISKKPIKEVVISRWPPEHIKDTDLFRTISDSTGSFHFHALSFSQKFNLFFSKTGYITQEVGYPVGHLPDTVFMVKTGK